MSVSSELGLLVSLMFIAVAVIGRRLTTKRLRGRPAEILVKVSLAIAALTGLATIAVFAIILRTP